MKFILQHNLMSVEQLHRTQQAVKHLPHSFVGLIPFSREFTSDEPLEGVDFIPYGSTLMTNLAYDLGWKGLFFNLDTFNYEAALKNRDDMLNTNVIRLDQAIADLENAEQDSLWFTRPSHDLKQFSGQVIQAGECHKWFRSMMECQTSGSYKLEEDTPIVLCEPQNIKAEWRYFIVDGKVISGSLYRAHNQLRSEEVTDIELLEEAQTFADKWLPSPCCVMDLALVGDDVKVIEFNTINSSGWYANDCAKVFAALWEYCKDM